jgi:hypothetical protein
MFLNLLFGALPGLAKAALAYFERKADRELEGFKTATGVDRESFRDYLNAGVENNRTRTIANGWWGAKAIILTVGMPCAVHMAAVMLDSMPFWGHPIGSWGIPKPPAPYDAYQRDIVLSFFLVMPAMPIVNAVAAWLGLRK